jgi:hypothetical protein
MSFNGNLSDLKHCKGAQDATVFNGVWARMNRKTGKPIIEKFYANGIYCGERRYRPSSGILLKEHKSPDIEKALKARAKRKSG